MSSPAEMAERRGRMLAELAELGLSLARDLHGQALDAETPQEKVQLAEAFNRISRSVRQSVALEAKLQREAGRDAHERRGREREARKAQLARRVVRLINDEVGDRGLAFRMAREAPDWVERESESESFLDEPIEAQVARIRAAMGLDATWGLADDDDEPAQAPPEAPHGPDRAAAPGEQPPVHPPAAPPPSPPRPPWASPYDDLYSSA
jgi:hypothetical protein